MFTSIISQAWGNFGLRQVWSIEALYRIDVGDCRGLSEPRSWVILVVDQCLACLLAAIVDIGSILAKLSDVFQVLRMDKP